MIKHNISKKKYLKKRQHKNTHKEYIQIIKCFRYCY